MTRKRQSNKLRSGLALAALALAACPAQAQFGNIVNPIAPRVVPLGGPINQFGFAGNAGAVSTFGGFSPIVFGNRNNFNNVPRNIAFAGDGSFVPQGQRQVAGGNQLINDPLSGFRQPRVIIDPSIGFSSQLGALGTSTLPVDTSLFFANNPGFSPFQVNSSVNGNFGINTFNTGAVGFGSFNTLNNGVNGFNGSFNNGFNTGFNGSFNNGLATSAFLNNNFNTQQTIIDRPAPAYNPTLPNRPASRYQRVMTAAEVNAMMQSQNSAVVRPWPIQPPPEQQSRFQYYPLANSGVNANATNGAMATQTQMGVVQRPWPIQPPPGQQSRYQYYPLANGNVNSTPYPWPIQPPPSQQSRYQYYPLNNGMTGSNGMTSVTPPMWSSPVGNPGLRMPPVIGGPPHVTAFGTGMAGGGTVFGGRAR